jgi:hypothetical protein
VLLTRPLDHLLSFSRRSITPPLAQHLPPLRRQLLESPEILAHCTLPIGWQRLKPLPTIT